MHTGRSRRAVVLPANVVAATVTTVVLLSVYLATSAPDLTVWDAPELVTAAHTLGIPHPPGTPVWVMLAHIATQVFASAGPARSVVLLSVWSTAIAGGLGAAMTSYWIGARGAVIAMVSAGAMMSVWNNATEAEVYAVSLLHAVAMLFAGERAGRRDVAHDVRSRWRGLLVFLGALSVPVHLSAMVALPAAVVLAWRGRRPTAVETASYVALALLALSAVMMLPLRAQHSPVLDSGHPVTLGALLDVLQRAQYAVVGLWPRRAPLWLQLGNVFEWADWQVAFGAHPFAGPAWPRTALSVLWVWLSTLGIRRLWREDPRAGRALLVLLLSGTFGVALWLNLHAGPSFGAGVLPDGAAHEARERDYFFVLGFWAWGMLAGVGLVAVASQLARHVSRPLANAVLAVAAVPLLLNGPVLDRRREPAASIPRVFARMLLDAVPVNGVLVVAGDNDTFPLWYLQQVEAYRVDVTVVTASLLAAQWYREQLASRAHLRTSGWTWSGQADALRAVGKAALQSARALRVSALVDNDERQMLDPASGWSLQGLVYAPTNAVVAGALHLDRTALERAAEQIPEGALAPLPPGTDAAIQQLQDLLRCTRIVSVADPLLVSTCSGP